MTASNDVLVSDARQLEDKFVTIWPDYQCLYDVRSVDFRNRDLRQQSMEAIGDQLDEASISKMSCRFQYLSTRVIGSPVPVSAGIARIKNILNCIS